MAALTDSQEATLADVQRAAGAAVGFLLRAVDGTGAVHDRIGNGRVVTDLAAYYKLPTALLLASRPVEAHHVLDHVAKTFRTSSGDFETGGEVGKTANEALRMFKPYMDIWLAIAAARLGRPDIVQPALQWVGRFRHPRLGGYMSEPWQEDEPSTVDVLLTAHMGLARLYTGDLAAARAAGACMLNLVDAQLNASNVLGTKFYLRLDGQSGKPVTDVPSDLVPFYVVDAQQPDQLYFMVGYPIAVFCKLYWACKDARYVRAAKQLADFCLTCHSSIYSSHWAHKVAWAAACLASITGDEKYRDLSLAIAKNLVSIQDAETGAFLLDQPPHDSIDQTAEISAWLHEVAAELQAFRPAGAGAYFGRSVTGGSQSADGSS